MARIRSVHPAICESEGMADLSAELERTFVRLWTHCDDEGRAKDNPRLIKAAIFPLLDEVTADVIDDHLDELARRGMLVRYEVDGVRYLAVPSWEKWQHPQKKRDSTLPPPPDTTAVEVPDESRTPTRTVAKEYGPVVGVVVGDGEGETTPPSPPSDLSPALPSEPAPSAHKRRARLPDDWQPNDHHAEFAADCGLDLEHERAQFRDHHEAKGSVMRDWDKAFWTWLRNASKWNRSTPRANGLGAGSAWEQVVNALQAGKRPVFDDRTESVIRAMGGWQSLRLSTNQIADRAHFIRFYEGAA